MLAERLPAMCGSETFTTVVSSTSMKVLDITAMAMSQGLICGCACGAELIFVCGSPRKSKLDLIMPLGVWVQTTGVLYGN